MWTFRKHRHLKSATLSEYLDGQLRGPARQKVVRELESCAACREELESLRVTVRLLQGLPQTPAPRSFTLSGPPPAPVAARPPTPLRMPNWAYAGAASLAGLALAVMVSADATGLLTPEPPAATSSGASVASAPAQEDAAATAEPAPLAATAPNETSVPQPPVATPEPESFQSFRAAPEPEDDEGAGDAPAAPPGKADETPVPDQETMSALQAAPTPEPGPAEDSARTGPAGPAAASQPPAEDKTAEPAPVPEPEALPQQEAGQQTGTPIFWRVLEGTAAALALAFLVGLVLRWRQSRRACGN